MSEESVRPAGQRPLADEEKAAVNELYGRFGAEVVREVGKYLHKVTKARTPASTSAVAQSVWASMMERHLGEVDLADEDSAWRLLFVAAGPRFRVGLVKKHCEKWNKRAHRHPSPSVAELGRKADDDNDSSAGFQVVDDRYESIPELVAMAGECSALLALLEEPSKASIGHAVARLENGIGLVEKLSNRERQVLGLKLAGRTRPEIAQILGISTSQVDDAWDSVKQAAHRQDAESP